MFNKIRSMFNPKVWKPGTEPPHQELDYIVKVGLSLEFGLWKHFDAMCVAYTRFLNSDDKRLRIEQLKELSDSAIRMKMAIKQALIDRAIPSRLVRTIEGATLPKLSNLYLNMTQLYQLFIHATNIEAKIHYLTSLFYLCEDLSAIALIESAEPDPVLEVNNKGVE